MNIDDNVFKLLSFGKSQDILDKIKFIQNELKKNTKINIINLSNYIQDLMTKRNLAEKENKFSEYNDVKENLFNILCKEEIDNGQKNNKELIKMDKDNANNNNKMEIESDPMAQNEEIKKLLMGNTQEEKKEEQLTGKKRTRDKKKKEKDKDKEEDNNNKKKNKKRKINNKENENNNINNNKGVKKEKDETLNKRKSKRNAKENSKKLNEDALKNFLDNFHAKNDKNNLNKKNSNSNSNTRKKTKKESQSQSQLDNKKNNNNIKTPKKILDTKKNPNKLIEDILKREFELGSKSPKQKVHLKNKHTTTAQNKDKIPEKEKADNKDKNTDNNNTNNTNNNNTVTNSNNKPNPKLKKKGKKIIKNPTPLIIDEELKKSTPIRNLKKRPKSILKKINLPNPPLQSATPIKFQKAKSSEKKINLSSESKNKKFRTFAEIFQSPSKLKATPLKRRVNSEKKSNLKINSILTADEKEEKKEVDNKKRNISFNSERIVKEYNPKTPVRDVKQRITRKSPLERKNRNDLIN